MDKIWDEIVLIIDSFIEIVREWFEKFTTWLIDNIVDFHDICEPFMMRVNSKVTIMRKKINRYLTYKRLVLWLWLVNNKGSE